MIFSPLFLCLEFQNLVRSPHCSSEHQIFPRMLASSYIGRITVPCHITAVPNLNISCKALVLLLYFIILSANVCRSYFGCWKHKKIGAEQFWSQWKNRVDPLRKITPQRRSWISVDVMDVESQRILCPNTIWKKWKIEWHQSNAQPGYDTSSATSFVKFLFFPINRLICAMKSKFSWAPFELFTNTNPKI